jgi:cell shape-determining protein MreD
VQICTLLKLYLRIMSRVLGAIWDVAMPLLGVHALFMRRLHVLGSDVVQRSDVSVDSLVRMELLY